MIFKIIIKQLFSFFKKTNRKFYKVNEGFNKDEDNNEIYGDGNLNDVSSSFLLVANMLITYLITQKVNEFYVKSLKK